jgi:hypothetical protein
MKIELGVGMVALVAFAGCGPQGVDLGGGRAGEMGEAGGDRATGGSRDYGGTSAGGSRAYGGTSAGGSRDYGGTSAGGTSAGGTGAGGSPTCQSERIESSECNPEYVLAESAQLICAREGRRIASISFLSCFEEGTANGASVLCCGEEGAGGTGGTGGSDPTGGRSYGGAAGSSSVGGSSIGGSSAGDTSAGGSSAGGPEGGTSAGGTSAGGSPAGGTGGAPNEECWRSSVVAESCADNDVFLGRGYERCEQDAGRLTSIEYTDSCDAYASLSAVVTCCAARGTGGAAGTRGEPAGGSRTD